MENAGYTTVSNHNLWFTLARMFGSGHWKVFLEIGIPKKLAKSLKNTSEWVHFLIKLQANGLQLYWKWTPVQVFFKVFNKISVCDSRDQLSVVKNCRKRFDLRCDRIPGSASDYLLCLGLALLVLSIKIHQFWLKIKFHFLLSLLCITDINIESHT